LRVVRDTTGGSFEDLFVDKLSQLVHVQYSETIPWDYTFHVHISTSTKFRK